ncbi:hypothetical protein [Geomesophilobacter sediminis]|uniref:Uncharacterized protein n=1 Tax=Geomesophilobacter sediminis TaxID=2798584 RepID=A0A8J7JJF8_9BACT|nr:hypothetical protein [Geomesophilobacter sediminis]MBJ6724635.1 hypothetical protein [Geomesophilobacter sediminis]
MRTILAILALLFLTGVAHAVPTPPTTAFQATLSIFDGDKRSVSEKVHEVRNAVLNPEGKSPAGAPAQEDVEARVKAFNHDFGWAITPAGNGELRFPSGNVYSMRNWQSFSAKGSTPDGVVITTYFEKPSGEINFDDGNGHFIVMQLSDSDVQVLDANLPLPTDFAQRLFLLTKAQDKDAMSKLLTGYFRAGANRTDTNFYEMAVYLLKLPAQRSDFVEWLGMPTVQP